MNEIERMLAETRGDRAEYRRVGRAIDAAACAIRERALEEALAAIKRERG